MRVVFLDTIDQISQWVSHYIIYRINSFQPNVNNPFILGLSTEENMIFIYQNLIKTYELNQINFENVVIFTTNEYLSLSCNNLKSYCSFIHKNFLDHINISKKNVNFLNGLTNNISNECQQYEKKIKLYNGGIRLLIGEIGENGCIAFNESGSPLKSRTRVVTLSKRMCLLNAKFFNNNVNSVPKFALTIGLGTLLDSQEIIILAIGKDKADAVQAAIEGSISHMWAISCLQLHPKTIIICDKFSSSKLKVSTIKHFQEIEIGN